MSDEPPPHFDQQDDTLTDPIFDELNQAGVYLSGDGTFDGELSRNIFLACPNFRILLHEQTEGPHLLGRVDS